MLRRQRGFLIIAAVFLLVVLAGLVAYLTTVSTTSQAASAADLNSARAYQASRAGSEWAAFLILRTAGPGVAGSLKAQCVAGTVTKNLTFAGTTLAPFTATVKCTSTPFTEGAASVRAYTIESNACNLPAANCPNTATPSATYVDRQHTLIITE